MNEIGDLVCGFAPHLLVLLISRKALDHRLSKTCLKEVHENMHLFEILEDDQCHGWKCCINIIEGLSFATRGNIVQKAGQVVDEFAVDHIREAFEFEQKFAPHLNRRYCPRARLPFSLVSIILVRYKFANLCGINDLLQPLVCLRVRLACWVDDAELWSIRKAVRLHFTM
jgi:hypothetical protein